MRDTFRMIGKIQAIFNPKKSQAIFNPNFRYRDVDPLRALLEEEIVTADRISLDRINFNSGNESLTLLLTFNITSSREFLFNSVTIFQLAFENSFDSIITRDCI